MLGTVEAFTIFRNQTYKIIWDVVLTPGGRGGGSWCLLYAASFLGLGANSTRGNGESGCSLMWPESDKG